MLLDSFPYFADELEKLAAPNKETQKRMRKAYYRANRASILAKKRSYRRRNAAQIRRQQMLYRRKVKSGAKRRRKRIHTGQSYEFAVYY